MQQAKIEMPSKCEKTITSPWSASRNAIDMGLPWTLIQ